MELKNLRGRASTCLAAVGIAFAFLLHTPAASSASPVPQDSQVTSTKESVRPNLNKTVIRQTSPATCGPAAIATLLTFYLGDPVTEEEMMKLAGTDKKTISNLRQLGTACRAKGYEAEGRHWNLPRLLREVETGAIPVLVHFQKPTEHFVLVIGKVDDFFLVSDPERGEVSVHQADFLRRWDGNVLVVKSTRPVNTTLIETRRRSAETRLHTLDHANSLMSTTRF